MRPLFFAALPVALTLMILPAEKSRVLLRRALFVKSDKKYQKAPMETHGFHPSFPRSTAQLALDFTARKS